MFFVFFLFFLFSNILTVSVISHWLFELNQNIPMTTSQLWLSTKPTWTRMSVHS